MLKYVGNGAALPDVPARDLSDIDLAERGLSGDVLVASGLYIREGVSGKSKAKAADEPPDSQEESKE